MTSGRWSAINTCPLYERNSHVIRPLNKGDTDTGLDSSRRHRESGPAVLALCRRAVEVIDPQTKVIQPDVRHRGGLGSRGAGRKSTDEDRHSMQIELDASPAMHWRYSRRSASNIS